MHIAWLLDEHALGDAILAIVRDAEIATAGRARVLGRVRPGAVQPGVAHPLRPEAAAQLKGYEKCWAPYLELVAALTGGQDTAPALAACAARSRAATATSG